MTPAERVFAGLAGPAAAADLRYPHAAEDREFAIADALSGLAESARSASVLTASVGYAREENEDTSTGPSATPVVACPVEESGRPGSNWHHQLGRLRSTIELRPRAWTTYQESRFDPRPCAATPTAPISGPFRWDHPLRHRLRERRMALRRCVLVTHRSCREWPDALEFLQGRARRVKTSISIVLGARGCAELIVGWRHLPGTGARSLIYRVVGSCLISTESLPDQLCSRRPISRRPIAARTANDGSGAHVESSDAVGERNVQNDHDNRCEENYEATDRAAPQHHRTHNRRNGEDPEDYGAEYFESAVSSLGQLPKSVEILCR